MSQSPMQAASAYDNRDVVCARTKHAWDARSVTILVLAWAVLQLGGLFSPGLLDDVDSVYIQIAREMLARHDFVTPTVDGIRFFDKPPLMYWFAAGSMRVFGIHDWAARLPLALGMLALLLAVYALGLRFFAYVSPAHRPDRAAFYAALAMATCIGPYLYTRFYIPDMIVALWMTLAVHLFMIALSRIEEYCSALLPMLGFAAVLAFSVLTKGLIGIVFPILFAALYLVFTHRLAVLRKLHLAAATLMFLLVAAPWHILAALRNPAITMPPGLGLPARAGWAWFYLYNEHIARFLGKRIPHDYGQVPVPLFWLLLVVWLVPWAAFLPQAIANAEHTLRARQSQNTRFDSDADFSQPSLYMHQRLHEAALTLLLWPGIVLGFFTLSSRQEYYHLPALPALALLVGALLAAADARALRPSSTAALQHERAQRQALLGSLYGLVPLGTIVALVCGYFFFAAHRPAAGTDLYATLASNPDLYNVSLGHVFDLTGAAMGFFRGPLLAVSCCMLLLGPGQHILRRSGRTYGANLLLAAAMTGVLLAAHVALVRFYPILGSKQLALTINAQRRPGDLIAIDGELTSGSTLLFYTGQPVLLVNGRVNGPWFGSFWPDAPHVFADDAELHRLWQGSRRIFLLTYHPQARRADLAPFGPVDDIAQAGGKTVLSNQP